MIFNVHTIQLYTMEFSKEKYKILSTKWNKANLRPLTSETSIESRNIYQTLCASLTMYSKYISLECHRIRHCLDNTLTVLLSDNFSLHTGSASEGTDITPEHFLYGIFLNPSAGYYFSDWDTMNVLYHVRVIEEGNPLPQRFGNYINCLAQRGKHTAAGFRKLRIIHNPEYYPVVQHEACHWASTINMAMEHEYISSTTFVTEIHKQTKNIPWKNSVRSGKSFIFLVKHSMKYRLRV